MSHVLTEPYEADHLLQPDESGYVRTGAPHVYIDNYMVSGYKSEHEALGGRRFVQLNTGIEGVSRGIVVTDRPVNGVYLEYLESLSLYSPSDVQLVQVHGDQETMMLRLLAEQRSAGRIRDAREEKRLKYIDTFGISELLGRLETRQSHRRVAHAVGLPMFYNSSVADRLRSKSTCRQSIRRWLEEEKNQPFLLPHGLEDLRLDSISCVAIRAFLERCPHEKVAVKKDIATYNMGNAFLDRRELLDHCTYHAGLRDFLLQKCPFLDGETFCLEEYVEHDGTPSAVLQILPDGDVTLKSVQEQVYVRRTLENFRYPTLLPPDLCDRLRDACLWIGQKLREEGYIGHAVPDFAINTAQSLIYLMEINMRRGGSTVGQRVAERLMDGPLDGDVSYITAPLRCRPDVSFLDVQRCLDGLHYDAKEQMGMLLTEAVRFDHAGILTLVAMTRRRAANALPEDMLGVAKERLEPLMALKKK